MAFTVTEGGITATVTPEAMDPAKWPQWYAGSRVNRLNFAYNGVPICFRCLSSGEGSEEQNADDAVRVVRASLRYFVKNSDKFQPLQFPSSSPQ